jgi:hypothetical protein
MLTGEAVAPSAASSPRGKRPLATMAVVGLVAIVVVGAVGSWLLSRPDDQELAQRALYEQVSAGPDGVRVNTGEPHFGAFTQQVVVFVVRRDRGGPHVVAPAGFRDVTADYRQAPSVTSYGMFASYAGSINGVPCSVSGFPADRRTPGLLGNVQFDPATQEAVAVELLC